MIARAIEMFAQKAVFALKHRNLCTRRKHVEKGQFFQLVSDLFCVVKRGVVKTFLCSKLPCLGWRSADFLQSFFCQKCLLDQRKHTRSSTKISMLSSYFEQGDQIGRIFPLRVKLSRYLCTTF
jgi:hypothetical protein